jgi:hypothetical protein
VNEMPAGTQLRRLQARCDANANDAAARDAEDRQLRLYPNWPDDRRAAANVLLRSALFSVVTRGPRDRAVCDWLHLPAENGWTIECRGLRLDQRDESIILELAHRARNASGSPLQVTIYSLARALGDTGGRAYSRLRGRLEDIWMTQLRISNGQYIDLTGALILRLLEDRFSGELRIWLGPLLRLLCDNATYLDFEVRQSLRTRPLAQWLHGFLSSHAEWRGISVARLRELCGSQAESLRGFRRQLREALEFLRQREVITNYEIDSRDRICLSRIVTPSQARHLSRSGAQR